MNENNTLEWTARPSGSAVPAEIIRNVLSLLGPQDRQSNGYMFFNVG